MGPLTSQLRSRRAFTLSSGEGAATTRRRRAFTLIEVVVALAVMVVIGTITWSTMAQTLQMRDYLEEHDRMSKSARVALDRIARELEVAFLTENTSAVNTYRTVFVGKNESDADQLFFATMTHARRYRDSRECDQTEITVWADDDPEERGKLVLYHREAPRIDQEPDQDGAIQPLARNVTRFDLTYLDPQTGEWADEWDTTGADQANRLPRAVQIVLGLAGPDPDDEDDEIERFYVRTVILETAGEMKKSVLSGSGGASDQSMAERMKSRAS